LESIERSNSSVADPQLPPPLGILSELNNLSEIEEAPEKLLSGNYNDLPIKRQKSAFCLSEDSEVDEELKEKEEAPTTSKEEEIIDDAQL